MIIMAAVTFIYWNELKFRGKPNQNSYHGKSTELNKDPHTRFADDRMERLSHERNPNDLYSALRSFLIFGKFIGLVPIQGLFQRDVDKLTFNKSSFPAIVSIIIWGILGINVVIGFVEVASGTLTHAGEYIWAPAYLLFYSNCLFTFVYFYRHACDYIQILRQWNHINLTFTKLDTTLSRDVNLMAFFVMTSAVFENLLFTFNRYQIGPVAEDSSTFIQVNEPQNASTLHIYYVHSNQKAPPHPLLAIVVFVGNKIGLYAWNYSDLIIAITSRALYHKFKTLYIQSKELLIVRGSSCDAANWKQFTDDHEALYSVLSDVAEFLSPMIFCSFGINIYYICLQLHLALTLTPDQTLAEFIYVVWSVLHLVIRVFILSLCATRINDWAHLISDIFRKCPSVAYTSEVERAEQFVSLDTIGLNGLGCFIVTKPLMLQLAGVVLTFEIVLLQLSQTASLPMQQ